jgi:hypothetical protein
LMVMAVCVLVKWSHSNWKYWSEFVDLSRRTQSKQSAEQSLQRIQESFF